MHWTQFRLIRIQQPVFDHTSMLHLGSSQCRSVIVPNKCKSRASNPNSSFWVNSWLRQSWIVEWFVPIISSVSGETEAVLKLFFTSLYFSFQLDLPFSIPFYRWLLYEDSSLGLSDLSSVAPEVQVTLKRLQNIVRERDEILSNVALDQETKNKKVRRNINYAHLPILCSNSRIFHHVDWQFTLWWLPDCRFGLKLYTPRSCKHRTSAR